MKTRPSIQITLTPEQQAQIAQATGRQIAAVELKPEALESRITPGKTLN